jgi:hypothetical protein
MQVLLEADNKDKSKVKAPVTFVHDKAEDELYVVNASKDQVMAELAALPKAAHKRYKLVVSFGDFQSADAEECEIMLMNLGQMKKHIAKELAEAEDAKKRKRTKVSEALKPSDIGIHDTKSNDVYIVKDASQADAEKVLSRVHGSSWNKRFKLVRDAAKDMPDTKEMSLHVVDLHELPEYLK